MNFVWDTNIIVKAVRDDDFLIKLNSKYNFFDSNNAIYISSVTIGEMYALALKNVWGDKRLHRMSNILQMAVPVPINNNTKLMRYYAEIDAFSQNKHPNLKLPTPARKMGKNDLWIAATSAIYNATLLSSDGDFEHLDGNFIYFEQII